MEGGLPNNPLEITKTVYRFHWQLEAEVATQVHVWQADSFLLSLLFPLHICETPSLVTVAQYCI